MSIKCYVCGGLVSEDGPYNIHQDAFMNCSYSHIDNLDCCRELLRTHQAVFNRAVDLEHPDEVAEDIIKILRDQKLPISYNP